MVRNNQKICVIGLGYVGFPMAVLCSAKGYEVIGFDTDKEKLKRIDKGENIVNEKFLEEFLPKAKIRTTANPKDLRGSDIFIIVVPTPVDEKYYPDLSHVISASEIVAKNMKRGVLVIIESTINPGVCEEVVRPIFEKAGFNIGKDVFISHCPERINPGDPKWNITNIPRVVGSFEKKGLKKSVRFYKSVISAEIMPMKSIREAEATKIMENSFRDINIAFVNELAKSFDLMNIDIVEVIRGAATKPFAFMAHWPSRGVGGHCIPVDPYYLIEKAKENNFDHRFLRMARMINNGMPLYTVELLQSALNKAKLPFKKTKIGLLGVSYKANVGDLRESPALKIIEILKKNKAMFEVYDPYLPNYSTVGNLDEILKKSEAILIAVNHREFLKIPVKKFKKLKIKVIVDGMNCLDKEKIFAQGIIYKGIGR